jgi:hypothetical protein
MQRARATAEIAEGLLALKSRIQRRWIYGFQSRVEANR